jgi:membrane-bound lytic murein transglycosylase D
LRYWNNVQRNLIRVGQKLIVYVPESKVSKYKNIGKPKKSPPKANAVNATEKAVELSGNYEYYQVRSGDNLWVIARKFPGVSGDNIKALNNMTTNDINPGQFLKIRPAKI